MQIDQLSHFPSAPFVESVFSELNRFVSPFQHLIEIVALVGATVVGVSFRRAAPSGE